MPFWRKFPSLLSNRKKSSRIEVDLPPTEAESSADAEHRNEDDVLDQSKSRRSWPSSSGSLRQTSIESVRSSKIPSIGSSASCRLVTALSSGQEGVVSSTSAESIPEGSQRVTPTATTTQPGTETPTGTPPKEAAGALLRASFRASPPETLLLASPPAGGLPPHSPATSSRSGALYCDQESPRSRIDSDDCMSVRCCAVVRHCERADDLGSLYRGQPWIHTDGFRMWPKDPPLSDAGMTSASEIGIQLQKYAAVHDTRFHVVVSSPYYRCVQTAVAICEVLGKTCVLLLDSSLGEIYGPTIMGQDPPRGPDAVTRPLEQAQMLCVSRGVRLGSCDRLLGVWPSWPEDLRQARERFVTRFLEYLQRASHANRNCVLVTHADGVGAALSVMPSAQGSCVEKVSFGGNFFAWRESSSPVKQAYAGQCRGIGSLTSNDGLNGFGPSMSVNSNESAVSTLGCPADLSTMEAPMAKDGWNVITQGIMLKGKQESNSSFSKRVRDLANKLRKKVKIEHLLGELPDRQLSDTTEGSMIAAHVNSQNQSIVSPVVAQNSQYPTHPSLRAASGAGPQRSVERTPSSGAISLREALERVLTPSSRPSSREPHRAPTKSDSLTSQTHSSNPSNTGSFRPGAYSSLPEEGGARPSSQAPDDAPGSQRIVNPAGYMVRPPERAISPLSGDTCTSRRSSVASSVALFGRMFSELRSNDSGEMDPSRRGRRLSKDSNGSRTSRKSSPSKMQCSHTETDCTDTRGSSRTKTTGSPRHTAESRLSSIMTSLSLKPSQRASILISPLPTKSPGGLTHFDNVLTRNEAPSLNSKSSGLPRQPPEGVILTRKESPVRKEASGKSRASAELSNADAASENVGSSAGNSNRTSTRSPEQRGRQPTDEVPKPEQPTFKVANSSLLQRRNKRANTDPPEDDNDSANRGKRERAFTDPAINDA